MPDQLGSGHEAIRHSSNSSGSQLQEAFRAAEISQQAWCRPVYIRMRRG